MLTPEQIEQNLNEVSERLRPAILTDSQLNANILVNHFHATGKEMTVENLFESMTGVLRDALQWDVQPEPKSQYDYPPVPPFMDFLKTKFDLSLITADGRFMRWMKSRHRDALNARANFILQNNIQGE